MRKGRPKMFMIRADKDVRDDGAIVILQTLNGATLLLRNEYPQCVMDTDWMQPAVELPPAITIPLLARACVLPDDWYDYQVAAIWRSRSMPRNLKDVVAYVYKLQTEPANCGGK